MKHFRPTSARIAVFHARHREKTASGLIYRPKSSDETLWGGQNVWVYRCGPDCKTKFAPGTHLILPDGSALIDDAPNTWDLVKDEPEFSKLRALVDQQGMQIQTKLIFEGAILAIDE